MLQRVGLRGRVILIFTIGAVIGSLVLVVSVFTISRGYLVGQRERWAERHAAAQADYVRDRLVRADTSDQESIVDVLDRHAAGTVLLLDRRGEWLASEAGILILDHPTRGIDVGAKDEIYRRIRDLAKAGLSIIVMCDTL